MTQKQNDNSNNEISEFNVNSYNILTIYNSLICLIIYGKVYNKKYNYKALNHIKTILDNNIKNNTPLEINRTNTHLMDKAVTCLSQHFNFFKIMCDTQGMSKSNIQDIKNSIPHTKKFIDHISTKMILNTNPILVKKRLEKDKRFIEHGFIREALDNMFKGFQINHYTAREHPTDIISSIAIDAIHNMSEKHQYDVYVVDDVATGTKHYLHHGDLTGDEFNDQLHFLHSLQDIYKQGQRYVIVDLNNHLQKVNQKQALELVNIALKNLNKITV